MSETTASRRGRLQTPGLLTAPQSKGSRSSNKSAASLEHRRRSQSQTPEPYPIGAPEATTPLPPWTPQYETTHTTATKNRSAAIHPPYTIPEANHHNNNNNTSVDDNDSVPRHAGTVPSPYSPPPSSLFSGEEFPPKSVRKPVSEVRLVGTGNSANGGRRDALSTLSLNHPVMDPTLSGGGGNLLGNDLDGVEDVDHHTHTVAQGDRSEILPTVLYLKTNLEEAQQSRLVLEHENRALSAECDRFQLELQTWKEQQQQASTETSALVQELRDSLATARADAATADRDRQRLERDLSAATARHTAAAQDWATREAELTDDQQALRTGAQEQAQAAADRLAAVRTQAEQTHSALQRDYTSQSLELDRLKAMLHEQKAAVAAGQQALEQKTEELQAALAQQNARANEAEDHDANTVLKLEVDRLTTALQDSNESVEELRDQKAVLEASLAHQECALQDEQARHALLAAAADDTKEQQLLMEKKALEHELANKDQVWQTEMDQLRQELAQTKVECTSLQSSSQQKSAALQQAYNKYATLRAERDALDREVVRTRSSLSSSASKKSSPASSSSSRLASSPSSELEDEVQRLQSALMKATSKCSELRSERSSLAHELAKSRAAAQRPNSPDETHDDRTIGSTKATVSKTNDAIPDRLGRMRDATERALVTQEYRRELHRLKADHETEIKRLTTRHDQDLRDVFDEAKSELSARAREHRRKRQAEHDAKVAALERRYQNELARTQRECEKSTAVAEEAMQAAASEVSAVTDQLDKEQEAREGLETKVRDLERKLVIESQKSKLSAEWLTNRKQWQQETNNLLANIQEECNTVFSQNIVRTASPRSVAVFDGNQFNEAKESLNPDTSHDFSRIGDNSLGDDTFPTTTPWKDTFKKSTSYKSPLDVSLAIDDTEAMIQSLMG